MYNFPYYATPEMKVIILAGGYGTRLEADLKKDKSGEFKHLLGAPKPLLPIGDVPLISHWMKDIQELPSIDKVVVVTRAGAISDMNLAAKQFEYDDDVIVLAGDTLFFDDFCLKDKMETFHKFQRKEPTSSMLVYVTCSDEEVHKRGILETDECSKVVGFVEKPRADETTSRKSCPCFYFLSKRSLALIDQFLTENKDDDLKARDAPGNFIRYLFPRMPVFATEISGRFDVGGLQSYVMCHEHFLNRKSQ